MTVATISAPQLRSLFEARWQADKDALALGLHVAHPCQAPEEVEFAFGKAQVVRADTVFQIREKLMAAERNKERIVLLTKLDKGKLGNDVVARLARNRLFHIDHFASLCALFKAKELDPLVSDPAIAEALLECKRRLMASRRCQRAFSTPGPCGGPSAATFSRWARVSRT